MRCRRGEVEESSGWGSLHWEVWSLRRFTVSSLNSGNLLMVHLGPWGVRLRCESVLMCAL